MQQSKNNLIVRPDGQLSFGQQLFRCALGSGGRQLQKTEGDGVTPVGRWPLRQVLYRPDRLSAPDCPLPVTALVSDDGWCDDPAHRDYNRPVKLPHEASCEELWRRDHVYDIIVTLGHNDSPVITGAGSAVFFHLARPQFEATQGCVAVTQDDMLVILAHLTPGCIMEIQAGG